MRQLPRSAVLFFLALIGVTGMSTAQSFTTTPDAALQALVDQSVQGVVKQFSSTQLRADQLAVTIIDVTDPKTLKSASHRGDQQVYPASVVKLFYLVAAHQWMEEGRLKDSEELRRAMRDMIVDSSNEATGLVVDALTDTTSGPELSKEDLERWYEKRNAVNRYFTMQGFRGINVNRKPWNDGPYGREMQSVKVHAPNHRNWLTTDATARLMAEIALDRSVTAMRSGEMKTLLHRDLKTKKDVQSQFTGPALPGGTKLWSKAGWTSQTRHDAVYLELLGGRKVVLVIFTEGHTAETGIIPAITKPLLQWNQP